MAGIYLHIPFCKQACHYCDFHFSTSLKKKDAMIDAICHELVLRKHEISENIETIYFGGGTPSLLSFEELQKIFRVIDLNFQVSEDAEITLEANPDDLDEDKLQELAKSPINRLSIGVQSFFEEDLTLMNRAHNATEARNCLLLAKKYFDNLSIDLIYGIPDMSLQRWKDNLKTAINLDIPHLSCYALTVEPATALKKFIEKGIVPPIDEELAKAHYEALLEMTEESGYENYEFSNFGRANYFSRNNTAYWTGIPYLGIGPSAHSFNGDIRSWNVRNNSKYINSLDLGELPIERETLSKTDKYNEYMMTGLRTKWGVSLDNVQKDFGDSFREYLWQQSKEHRESGLLILQGDVLYVSDKGKFLTDGISSDLFMINLS